MSRIKDIKPPQFYFDWQKPIENFPLIDNKDAAKTLLNSQTRIGELLQKRVEDLRGLIEYLLANRPEETSRNYFMFHHLVFMNADLNGLDMQDMELYFRHCYFLEDVDLRNSKFKSLDMAGDYIYGILAVGSLDKDARVSFSGLQIDKLHISNLQTRYLHLGFNTIGTAGITDSDIESGITIDNSTHMTPVFIENIKCNGDLEISDSTFNHVVYLRHLKSFQRIAILNSTFEREVETQDCLCGNLSLEGSIFKRTADFRRIQFNEIDVSQMGADGSLLLSLDQLRGDRTTFRSDFNTASRVHGDNLTKPDEIRGAASQLLSLRKNFHMIPGMKTEEDYCTYRLMETTRRLSKERLSSLAHWFYKWLFGYMVLPQRIIITIIMTILLFTIAYGAGTWLDLGHIIQDGSGSPDSKPVFDHGYMYGWARCLYFSVITFTTVGYGDIHPSNWLKLIAMLEGLIGVFLMAVFTVSIARKILRW